MASYTGTSGHDIITGSTGPDYISGYSGDDQLFGLDSFDTLYGNNGNDRLVGGAGNDKLYGGGARGDDLMEGGTGDDYYQVETAGDVVVELDGEGVDMVDAFCDIILGDHVEILRMRGGTHAIGNDSANRIYTTGDQSRILEGRGGDDHIFASSTSTDTLLGGDGDDVLEAYGHDLLDGGAGNDTLLNRAKGAGADLFGGEGNDLLLVGEGSTDRFVGGLGDDSYVLHERVSGATIIEHADEGSDTITAHFDYTLGDHFENLVLAGYAWRCSGNAADNSITGMDNSDQLYGLEGDDTIRGGSNDDVISGNDGADLLEGEDGDDWLLGGSDSDRLRGGAGADRMVGESGDDELRGGADGDSLQGQAGDDLLAGDDGDDLLGGGADNDRLDGGAGNDRLDGSAGDDVLTGGSGQDEILGGGGFDIASFADAGRAVKVRLHLTEQRTGAGTDYLAGIEGVTGSAFDDTLGGDGNANVLDGAAGDDWLGGEAGDDVLIGGDGRDTASYLGSVGGVTARLDTEGLQATGGAGVDRLVGIEDLTGSTLDDDLTGDGGDNRIDGRGGDDRVHGLTGDDRLAGQGGHDRLAGGDGSDILVGGTGNDTIIGGAQRDELTGSAGADSFVLFPGQLIDTPEEADSITDFAAADGDLIHLRFIDARDATPETDDAFTFIGAAAFSASGVGGELRYEIVEGHTFVSGDIDGDGAADFFIRLDGAVELAASDFVL